MNLDLRTQSQVVAGLFEYEVHPWLRRFATGIRCAIDVGAAHGEYTLWALLRTSAEKVLAFEPDSQMVSLFEQNLVLNGVKQDSRLQIIRKFLSASEGQDYVSVDWLAEQIESPCLIKMDIDGGEVDVLRAAQKRLLQKRGLRWIVETHSKALERECQDILSAAGYRTRIVANGWWRTIIPEQRVSEQNRWLVAADASDLL